MPRLRQRIVLCDCLDCVEQPATTDIAASTSAANEAAARQEPPPKCLLICATGALQPTHLDDPERPTSLELRKLPHFNKATKQGNLTLLTMLKQSTAGSSQRCILYSAHACCDCRSCTPGEWVMIGCFHGCRSSSKFRNVSAIWSLEGVQTSLCAERVP